MGRPVCSQLYAIGWKYVSETDQLTDDCEKLEDCMCVGNVRAWNIPQQEYRAVPVCFCLRLARQA
jgi:hypothetical protein